jgi:hypothetical protein
MYLRPALANGSRMLYMSRPSTPDAGQLVVLPFRMPWMERNIGVTTRRGTPLSPGARALLAGIERRQPGFA